MSLKSLFNRLVHGRPPRGVLEFHILNAFTDARENATGNPASICIVNDFPTDAQMGQLAKTLNTAMTTFLRRTEAGDTFEIRHFSPDGNESNICGHAMVAACEHLAMTHPEFRSGKDITFRVNPKYKLNATNTMHGHIGKDSVSIVMPAVETLQAVAQEKFHAALADALNIAEDRIEKPVYFAPHVYNYLVVLKDQNDLTTLTPDFAKLNALSHAVPALTGGIVPFWVLTAKSDNPQYDVMHRVFSPDIGVDEDPACGSANCSAIPYWHGITGKADFKVLYPYPPAGNGQVGGVQHAEFDIAKGAIILTASATYQQTVELRIPAPNGPRKSGPKL